MSFPMSAILPLASLTLGRVVEIEAALDVVVDAEGARPFRKVELQEAPHGFRRVEGGLPWKDALAKSMYFFAARSETPFLRSKRSSRRSEA